MIERLRRMRKPTRKKLTHDLFCECRKCVVSTRKYVRGIMGGTQ